MDGFEHERLDVYRASIELVAGADQLADRFPRGRAYLSDQLRRAVASIPLNIAEGAGEFLVAVRALLLRITAMLTAMVLKLGSSSSGSGSGSGSGST